ncbi:MAG TPA: hypothetical protein VLT17_02495 [Gemmatimonadales bacterium]|nr:hypothetical protein [Gemmatimonadales bacterium]
MSGNLPGADRARRRRTTLAPAAHADQPGGGQSFDLVVGTDDGEFGFEGNFQRARYDLGSDPPGIAQGDRESWPSGGDKAQATRRV